jgi:hypothetical protein
LWDQIESSAIALRLPPIEKSGSVASTARVRLRKFDKLVRIYAPRNLRLLSNLVVVPAPDNPTNCLLGLSLGFLRTDQGGAVQEGGVGALVCHRCEIEGIPIC